MNFKRAVIMAIVLMVAGLVANHFYLRPEARVKDAVARAIAACENVDRVAVESFFHPAFSDSLGLGGPEWMQILDYSWQRYKQIDLKLIQPEIEIDGDEAVLRCHIRVEATIGKTIGQSSPPMRPMVLRKNVELRLRHDDAGWRLVGVGDVTAAEWGVPVGKVLGKP